MSGRKGKHTAFTLVIETGEVRVRKAFAPVTRVLEGARRKKPRRRPDFLAETDDFRPS